MWMAQRIYKQISILTLIFPVCLCKQINAAVEPISSHRHIQMAMRPNWRMGGALMGMGGSTSTSGIKGEIVCWKWEGELLCRGEAMLVRWEGEGDRTFTLEISARRRCAQFILSDYERATLTSYSRYINMFYLSPTVSKLFDLFNWKFKILWLKGKMTNKNWEFA